MIPILSKDGRLELLTDGQYRMLGDSHTVLVPIGQSTTKPLTPEKIEVNVLQYGEINNGYFKSPYVDFTNTFPSPKRFDVFQLGIYRDYNPNPEPGDGSLPFDDPTIDYHDDLGLNEITAKVNIVFECNGVTGLYDNIVVFRWYNDGIWMTETLEFNDYTLNNIVGKFYLLTDQNLVSPVNKGEYFNTGQFLQATKLPIYCAVERGMMVDGNSKIDLLLQNLEWELTIQSTTITLIRGAN